MCSAEISLPDVVRELLVRAHFGKIPPLHEVPHDVLGNAPVVTSNHANISEEQGWTELEGACTETM